MLDVLCVSDMTADLIVRGRELPRFGQVETLLDDYILEIGGSANIFASQFCKLGGRAGVVGCVGADVSVRSSEAKLTTIGVDLRHLRDNPRLKTGISAHLNHQGDRAILTYLGTADGVRAEDLTDDLPSVRATGTSPATSCSSSCGRAGPPSSAKRDA